MVKFTAPKPPRRRPTGQALVEFALVFPVFVLMLMGLIDLGRFVYTDSALSQAAREGARVGAAEAGWVGLFGPQSPGCVLLPGDIGAGNPGAHVCPADAAHLKQDVVGAVNRMAVSLGQISLGNVYLSCNSGTSVDPVPVGAWTETAGASSPQGNGCQDSLGNSTATQGDLVSVRITYTYVPITPIISSIVPSQPRSASATMVIN